ncbi:unnamed protein product [Sphagnum troendelagicum]|uniref:Uncharacterized protein n=1 Tax=Sphagnum troendelagicum TaxID=128251 RepID=A0ABP0UPA6_9BRYO
MSKVHGGSSLQYVTGQVSLLHTARSIIEDNIKFAEAGCLTSVQKAMFEEVGLPMQRDRGPALEAKTLWLEELIIPEKVEKEGQRDTPLKQ